MTGTDHSPASSGPIDPKFVSLILASPDNAAEVAMLHAASFSAGWSEEAVKGLLENPGSCVLIAKVRNPDQPDAFDKPPESAGFILAQIAADQAEVMSMAVTPPFQRKGIGHALVDGMLRILQGAEVTRLFLDVAEDNAAGRALYETTGFELVSRREAYYKHDDKAAVDALVLSRLV